MATLARPIPPPKYLSKPAQAQWNSLLKILIQRKTIETGDLPAFLELIMALDLCRQARETLHEEGLVVSGKYGPKNNPAAQILKDAQSTAMRLFLQFGLTPASRNRAHQAEPPARDDPMQEFM